VRTPLVGRRTLACLLLAGLAAAQLLAFPGHYLGQEHDDAQYVLAARALACAEYRLGISPGNPRLTFVTPGWPALLAPAAWIFKGALWGYQFWAYLWLVLCDVLVWLYFRRRAPPAAAAAAVGAFALNPLILTRSGVVMSEVPALAAALGLLLLLDLGLPAWAAGLWAGAAWLIRPAAAALFPAVLGLYLCRRRFRDAAIFLAAGALPVLAWRGWIGSAGAGLTEFEELALNSPRGLSPLLSMAGSNIRQALFLWGQSSLPWPSVSAAPCLILGSILALAAGAGLWRQASREGYDTAAVFLAAGALMHAFWPWWYERYLAAFLPFLIWAVWRSFSGLGGAKPAALLLIWALSPLVGQSLPIMTSRDDRSRPELAATYAWIRGRTNAWDAVASAFYCRDALYAGRPFVPLPSALAAAKGSYADLLRERRAKYVLWEPIPDLGSSRGAEFFWSLRLEEIGKQLAGPAFRKAYANAAEKTAVYEVEGP